MPTKAAAKTPYELWTGRKPSLKQDLISLMKRNWTLKQLATTLLAMQSDQGVLNFMILLLGQFFETGTATFFEDVEFGGRNQARNIVFEEEEGSTIAIIMYRFHYLSLIKK